MTLMQRPGTHVAMLAAVGIRFAAALAAAGIMLSGCSVADGILGGSDKDGAGMTMTPAPAPAPTPTPTPTPTPAPAPGPSADARSKFFPITSGQVTSTIGIRIQAASDAARDGEASWASPPAGSTLETLVSQEWTSRTFPQFSEFEFGSPADSNGIPLQKATAKTASGENPRSIAAYQAVLEHSMFIFQGGLYRYAVDGVHSARAGVLALSVGVPTRNFGTLAADNIAGTWKGKAVGLEMETGRTRPYFPLHPSTAENLIVQGDVEIGVTLSGADQDISFEFDNWIGGSNNYPAVNLVGEITSDSLRITRPVNAPWTSQGVTIQFYGPGRAEAGGSFQFGYPGSISLMGVYGAKKQAE